MKKVAMLHLWFLLVAMTTALCIAPNSHAVEKKTDEIPSVKGGGPIEIVADRLEAYNAQKLVVFSGNVVVTQTDKILRANQLNVYYKQKEKDGKTSDKNMETGDLDRIEAKGNVRLTQGEKIVTGDSAVFYNDAQKLIMTGNPVMQEGNNIVRGDKITVLLNENRGIIESSKGKRVTATIHTDESAKNKKSE